MLNHFDNTNAIQKVYESNRLPTFDRLKKINPSLMDNICWWIVLVSESEHINASSEIWSLILFKNKTTKDV